MTPKEVAYDYKFQVKEDLEKLELIKAVNCFEQRRLF